jgi:hypothetical protein
MALIPERIGRLFPSLGSKLNRAFITPTAPFGGQTGVGSGDSSLNMFGRPRPSREGFLRALDDAIKAGGWEGLHAQTLKNAFDALNNGFSGSVLNLGSRTGMGGMVGINDYGFKGKRQYIADRRYLLDLYVIALNNADIRTATTHLRNEIFRRGFDWEPAFEWKCRVCEHEYTTREAKKFKFHCKRCADAGVYLRDSYGNYLDEDGKPIPARQRGSDIVLAKPPVGPKLEQPDESEIRKFDRFLEEANYFGQSLEDVLRECEDDINVVDDAFLYYRKRYTMDDETYERAINGDPDANPDQEVMQVFRLEPVLVELDLDYRGVPGMRHHLCVFHRDNLLEVPPDEGWDVEWKGVCPECGLRTYPVYYKYNEQYLQGGYGTAQSKVLYLLRDEVTHWSRYTGTETYGFPPILSIYEKALTLIGMDRYLYDYFFERRVPQGVVTVVTDDVNNFEATKSLVEAKMQQDPHYIPWMAIASKSGQGRMEFVRFAYSLDELNYLPVRDEIRERISGIYGVSNIWMQSMTGVGGLNSETQQLTVMTRVVEGAQRSYHTAVFPKLERALGVKDWHLRIQTPDEMNEQAELSLFSLEIQNAQSMASMGFGVEYDSDAPIGSRFAFYGKVKSRDEQMQEQMSAMSPFGGGGGQGGVSAAGGGQGGATVGGGRGM